MQKVLHVSQQQQFQYKVDIPGSPRDFVSRIASFDSWSRNSNQTEEQKNAERDERFPFANIFVMRLNQKRNFPTDGQ